MTQPRLHATAADLTRLASDLDAMQEHLATQIGKLNALVDASERGWRSPAASVYRDLQRSANGDAETVRRMLGLIAEAVRMSRDGFSAQDLGTLESLRALDVPDFGSSLPAGGPSAAPSPSHSRLSGL